MECLFTSERAGFLWCCHSYDIKITEAVEWRGVLSHFWPLTVIERRYTTILLPPSGDRADCIYIFRKRSSLCSLLCLFFYFFERNFILLPANLRKEKNIVTERQCWMLNSLNQPYLVLWETCWPSGFHSPGWIPGTPALSAQKALRRVTEDWIGIKDIRDRDKSRQKITNFR